MLTEKSANRKDLRTGKASLQHRHFTTIAAIIRNMTGEDFEGLQPVIARHFARELADTNPNFDYDRFLAACKPLKG